MPDETFYQKITTAISRSSLRRNVRGQLRAALDVLPLDRQKLVACDFAENGFGILLQRDPARRSRFQQTVTAIREFLDHTTEVARVRESFQAATQCERAETTTPSNEIVFSRSEPANLLSHLYHCCCQRELEAARLVLRRKYQPDAFVVADEAATMIAHEVGGADWNSDDPAKRKIARDRGTHAGHDETRWQIQRILEVAARMA